MCDDFSMSPVECSRPQAAPTSIEQKVIFQNQGLTRITSRVGEWGCGSQVRHAGQRKVQGIVYTLHNCNV
jgi:hypothetical protein